MAAATPVCVAFQFQSAVNHLTHSLPHSCAQLFHELDQRFTARAREGVVDRRVRMPRLNDAFQAVHAGRVASLANRFRSSAGQTKRHVHH